MTQEAQATPARAAGLTAEEAARRLAARGDLPPPPSSRSVASIVRSNTLTLFNLILAAFFVLILAAGRPADGLFAGILVANTAIGIIQELRAKRDRLGHTLHHQGLALDEQMVHDEQVHDRREQRG